MDLRRRQGSIMRQSSNKAGGAKYKDFSPRLTSVDFSTLDRVDKRVFCVETEPNQFKLLKFKQKERKIKEIARFGGLEEHVKYKDFKDYLSDIPWDVMHDTVSLVFDVSPVINTTEKQIYFIARVDYAEEPDLKQLIQKQYERN